MLPETPGVRMPSAMTAQVPQVTVTNKRRFKKLLPSSIFLNFLLELSESECLASPSPLLRLDRDWSFLCIRQRVNRWHVKPQVWAIPIRKYQGQVYEPLLGQGVGLVNQEDD